MSTLTGHLPQTALITGASSGIGRDLAELFAADMEQLVVVARREDSLTALARELQVRHGTAVHVLAMDLAAAEAPRSVYEKLSERDIRVDVLVNNAGFGLRGAFAELSFDRQLQMISLNVGALTALTRLFLPTMLTRNRGGILNVGSTAAFSPGPSMAVYYATKAYVQSFTEALVEEVRGSALRIACLAPGPTATEFVATAGMHGTRLFRLGALPSAFVARLGYEGWKDGKTLIVPGLANKLAVAATRFTPRVVLRKFIRLLNSRPDSPGRGASPDRPARSP